MSVLARALPLFLVALLGWWDAAQAQGWTSFSPPDGKYSIDMPGRPKEVRQTAMIDGQPAELHQYALEVGDSEAFITAYSDLRSAPAQPADLMSSIQRGVVASFKGARLRSERAVQFGKYPGRVFSLQTMDGAIYSQQIAVVGNRIYQNIAVSKSGTLGDGRTRHFFDSFRILKP